MHWFDYVMSRCPRHGDYDEHDDLVVYQDGRWVDFWKRVHPSFGSFFHCHHYRRRRRFRSSRHIVVLIVVSFFSLSFILFVYFVLLYIYDLLATVILLAPSCFVRLLCLYELLCWIEFSISHLLPSSPEYYTERQHPQDPCVAVTSS